MAEMSFGARRHTAVRKAEEDSTPTFNIQALLQGCVATRPDDSSDQTPLIVDFPDRPAKMLAAVLSDYGPAKRLKVQMCDLPRLPLGKLKSTEVVVEVHAASVNPTDCKQRNGQLSQIWPLTLPCVLGVDLAGRVVRAGEDAPFSEGDEVFGRQQLGRMVDINGSYAEYCIVEGADIYRKPSRLTMEEAAAVPYSCLAAYAALAHVGKLAEKRKQADKAVFVLGGSGGVGTFAVQLAKQHFDCFVVASSSEGNIGLLNELGVDEALDYEDPSFLKAVGYTKFDVILDTVGGDDYWSAFKDSLKPDGVYVTTVGKERRGHDGRTIDMSAALSYRADYFLRQAFNSIGADKKYHILTGSQILSSDLRIVASIFEKGIIHPVIAKVYSLYDIAKAHEMSETHHAVGKIVLQVKNGGRETPDGAAPRHDKTAGLQSQMQGVLANKGVLANRDLGPPGNRHGGSKLPTSKVQFNPQVQEPHDDDSEDEYPSLADAPGGRGGVTGGAPGSRTTDILGERVGAQPAQPFQPSDMTQRMTFGAPGSTSTLTKPHSANRPSSALGGGSGLEDRLEQLQREVMESTARVQALKEKNSTMLGGVGTSAVASDHVVGNGRAVGGKGESVGTKTEREAPPSLLPAELSHVASGKVVGTEDRDGGEGSDSSPPRGRSGGLSREDLRMGKGLSAGSSVMARGLEEIDFDAQTSANLGLDSAALEAGLAALQQERLFPRDGAPPSHGHGPKSSLEPWDDSAPGYRQGATKEMAPPSTDASDPAVAAKRAAALAKLREMTLGKGMGALGASDADSEGAGGGGLSAAALREARMNAERMKAQASALPRPEDEEEEQPRSDAAAFAGVRRGIEEEEEGGSGGEREARRMGVGGRDDAAAMFQQFKMGMGASSVASAVGSQDSSAPKPYAVRMVSAPVHAHALLDEVIPEDETPPPPRPQVGTAGISGGGGQRPAGAKPRVRINDQAAEREIPGKDEVCCVWAGGWGDVRECTRIWGFIRVTFCLRVCMGVRRQPAETVVRPCAHAHRRTATHLLSHTRTRRTTSHAGGAGAGT